MSKNVSVPNFYKSPINKASKLIINVILAKKKTVILSKINILFKIIVMLISNKILLKVLNHYNNKIMS